MEEKTGEITNLPILIGELDIGEGDVVTIDAVGTQTKIAQAIVEKGEDYILEVTDNQPKLKEPIAENIQSDMLHKHLRNDEAEEFDESRGRIVRRRCFVCAEKLCLGRVADDWARLPYLFRENHRPLH